MIIGSDTLGKEIKLDIDRLIETKLLVQANSGGGKSWAIRRILEQTHARVQHLVIDPEGEFYTLREKYDYVLAGKGGDCPADPRSAALLAHRLLELGTSAILDIYELHHQDRIRFVRLFLESLVNAPKSLWHPTLVVIDEAHMFAPEVTRAESGQAVIDLQTRGRKRGFCGILATQRPAALDKNASAQCNNKLIGRFSQDIDVARAAKDLGFYKREDQAKLRTLRAGQFFAVGPAISDDVSLVTVGSVETTHPRAGQRAAAPPPAREKVRAILAQLADLPAEAEQEARTSAELRNQVKRLEAELKNAGKPDPEITAERESEIRKEAARSVHEQYASIISRIASALPEIGAAVAEGQAISQFVDVITEKRQPVPATRPQLPPRILEIAKHVRSTSEASTVKLPVGERAVLTVCAQYPDGATREQISILTGYKRSSRDAYLQRLREKGFVENGSDLIRPTGTGIDALGSDFEPLPTGEDLQVYWRSRLPEGERKVFDVTVAAYPQSVDRESIDQQTDYKRSSRDAYIQRLKSRKLVEIVGRGEVRASEVLFG